MTSVEAKALIASSATVVKTILGRYDSFSIDDMCRQLISLCDYIRLMKKFFRITSRDIFFLSLYWWPRVL